MSKKSKAAKPFPGPVPEKIRLTCWDKVKLFGCPFVAFGLVMWLFIIGCINQQSAHVDERLRRWQTRYHLTEEQIDRLREIERSFHGSGNPFSSIGNATPEEIAEHHRAMSQAMMPEDGKRFLEDTARNGRSH